MAMTRRDRLAWAGSFAIVAAVLVFAVRLDAKPVEVRPPADRFVLACEYDDEQAAYAHLDGPVPSEAELREFGPGVECVVYNLAACKPIGRYVSPVAREDGATFEDGIWGRP